MATRGSRLHHVLSVGHTERSASTGYRGGVPVPNAWAEGHRQMALDDLKGKDTATRRQIENYEAQVARLRKRITTLQAAGAPLRRQLANAQAELIAAEARADAAVQRYTRAETDLQGLRIELAGVEADLRAANTTTQASRAEVETLRREIERYDAVQEDLETAVSRSSMPTTPRTPPR